jgi:hypothetical protein
MAAHQEGSNKTIATAIPPVRMQRKVNPIRASSSAQVKSSSSGIEAPLAGSAEQVGMFTSEHRVEALDYAVAPGHEVSP